jgi:hypothetical protein
MKWQELLRHEVRGDTITTSVLRKIPQLKTCPRWDHAVFLGRVRHSLAFASYDGGLVVYEDRIYYVNLSQIEALRPFVRWDLKKRISVIEV